MLTELIQFSTSFFLSFPLTKLQCFIYSAIFNLVLNILTTDSQLVFSHNFIYYSNYDLNLDFLLLTAILKLKRKWNIHCDHINLLFLPKKMAHHKKRGL